MNRYFVFKKVRNVNMTSKVATEPETISVQIEELEKEETKVKPTKVKKNKKKVVIEKN